MPAERTPLVPEPDRETGRALSEGVSGGAVAWFAVKHALWVFIRRLFGRRLLPSWTAHQEILVGVIRYATANAQLSILRGMGESGTQRKLAKLQDKISVSDAAGDGFRAKWVGGDPSTLAIESDELVILYLHGGAFVLGHPLTQLDFLIELLSSLKRRGQRARVLSLAYSLAPEHPFPLAIQETVAAYRWLCDRHGLQPHRVVLAGESAGGNIALCAVQEIRDRGLPVPTAGMVLVSPSVDFAFTEENTPSVVRNSEYDILPRLGDRQLRDLYLRSALLPDGARCTLDDPRISPVNADFAGFPSVMLVSGGREMYVDSIKRLRERLLGAGVHVEYLEHPEMIHAYAVMLELFEEQARAAIESMAEFIAAPRAGPTASSVTA